MADRDKVDLLALEIQEHGRGCERVVLLGDIFDLWRARPEKAIRDGKYFFYKLREMDMKVSYVVGNHDHHLTIMYQESEFLERIARGDVYSVYSPNLNWSRTINGLGLNMHYPTCSIKCLNRNFLLTHGHHLDGIQAFTLQVVEKIRRLSGEDPSPADLEMMMAYAYESIYRSSYIGEMADIEDKLWKISSGFSRFKAGAMKAFRPAPIESHYDSILKFIRGQHAGRVDCFIYGDTHKAGAYSREGGPLVVNIGSFTGENKGDHGRDIHDTYLVLSDEGMELRQLGRMSPLIASKVI